MPKENYIGLAEGESDGEALGDADGIADGPTEGVADGELQGRACRWRFTGTGTTCFRSATKTVGPCTQ